MATDRESMFAPWPTMLLASGVLGLILSGVPRLETARPPLDEGPVALELERGQVDARLWQDPFAAVRAGAAVGHADGRGWVDGAAALEESQMEPSTELRVLTEALSNGESICVMPAMVSGGPYVEDRERRLGSRYAVLSALAKGGYLPQTSRRLRSFRTAWPRTQVLKEEWSSAGNDEDSDCCGANSEPDILGGTPACCEPGSDSEPPSQLTIPYEVFEPDPANAGGPGRYDKVVVLWLRDDAFTDYPAQRLTRLVWQLLERSGPEEEPSGGASVKVLGPSHSGLLGRMLNEGPPLSRENRDAMKDADFLADEKFHLYSSWSVIPLQRLAAGDMPEWAIAKELDARGYRFRRSVGTARASGRSLVEELQRRGVTSGDRVALISEWDTTYGRLIPELFQEELEHHAIDVRRVAYLRGVDGVLPGEDRAPRGLPAASPGAGEAEVDTGRPLPLGPDTARARPADRHQLDYLWRIAGQLREEEPPGAIGVLGSDVYDKLLAIRVLRDRFPDAIFFTTDLDARLFHPSELDWTRNLLVVSSFGLALQSEHQGQIPPFRNTYQTSLFYAALKALNLSDAVPNSPLGIEAAAPRIFQIGRDGPWDITPLPDADEAIHPPRQRFELPDVFGWTGGALLITLAAWALSYGFRFRRNPNLKAPIAAATSADSAQAGLRKLADEDRQFRRRFRTFLGVAWVLLIPGFLLVVWWFDRSGEGEPLALYGGISIWPGQWLRLLGVMVAFGALIIAYHRFRSNGWRLTLEYDLGRPTRRSRLRGQRRELCRRFRQLVDHASLARWPLAGIPRRTCEKLAGWWQAVAPSHWEVSPPPTPRGGSAAAPPPPRWTHVRRLWHGYRCRTLPLYRTFRFVPIMLAVLIIGYVTMALWHGSFMPTPPPPARSGNWTALQVFDTALLLTSVALMLFLVFFVVDATQVCARFVHHLSSCHSIWPREPIERERASRWNQALRFPWSKPGTNQVEQAQEPHPLGELLDVQLIGRRTQVVGELIIYPFIVLVLLVAARAPFFDNWAFPVPLYFFAGVLLLIALMAAYALRREAREARRRCTERLQWWIERERAAFVVARSNNRHRLQARIEALQSIRDEINNIRTGAYSSTWQSPLFTALLVPVGGYGAWEIALRTLPTLMP